MTSSRALKGLLIALAVSLGASASGQAATAVKQAGFKSIDLAVPYLAKEKGFFEKNGLDWTFVEIDSGKLGIAALLSGNVQFVDLGLDDIAGLQAQGKDPLGVYGLTNSLTMDLVVSNKAIQTAGFTSSMSLDEKLKRLKGLTFGITRPGAPTQMFVQYLMQRAGLDPEKDATFVQIGGGVALVSAIKAGRIDGFLLSAPSPYIVEKDKAGMVLIRNSAGEGPPELKDFAFTTLAVLKSYAEAHPDVTKAYMLSLNQAQDWMKAHPAEALAALKPYFPDTDEATLKLSFDAIVPAMSEHGKLTETAVANQLNVLKKLGAIDGAPSPAEGVLWTGKYNVAP